MEIFKDKTVFITGASRGIGLCIKNGFEKEGARAFGVAFTDYKEINDRLSKSEQIDLIYYPKLNEYKGNKNVEISLVEYR